MPFIGNQPADKFLTLEKQVFTTSATDTYTLDREVSSVNDLELFLNNVRQEPTEAYTISGTTLTLASAITSSDSMYCVYQGRAVGTTKPADNTVTNDMLVNSSITLNGSAVSLGGSATTTISQSFESSAQTLSADSEATIAHGLGVEPKFINLVLECTSAIDGYSVGDRIFFGSGFSDSDRGLTCWADSTNVYLVTGLSFIIARRSGAQNGDTSFADFNEFDVIVRAYA